MSVIKVKKSFFGGTTFQGALDKANHGDEIILYPGEYHGSFNVSKKVKIYAETKGTVKLTGCLIISDHVKVEGLNITGLPAIQVKNNSNVEITNCDLSGVMDGSELLPVVDLDRGSRTNILNCKVYDSSGAGIAVSAFAIAYIYATELSGLKGPALSAESGNSDIIGNNDPAYKTYRNQRNLIAEKVLIHNTFSDGVVVRDGSQCTIKDSDIQSCGADSAAVIIAVGSRGNIIENCKIHDTPSQGVVCLKSSEVEIVDSEFWGIRKTALLAYGQFSTIKATRVSIRNTFGHGFFIRDKAWVIIRNSEIQFCGEHYDAVRFDNGSESFISDCKIHDISGNGIYIFRSASISVDNSEFWGIKQAALAACGSGAGLTATKVSIHDTFSHGVLTEQQAQSTIIDSDIQSCGDDCVAVNFTSNSNGTISGCKIHSNSGHGVGASKSSVVEIVDSEFWGIKQIALAAGGAGTVLTATKVSIHDTFSHGVKVQNNAQCVIRDSEIQSCGHDCAFLYFGSSSKGEIRKCKIHDKSLVGVEVSQSSVVEIIESEFWGFNAVALIAYGPGTMLTVTKVLIRDTLNHGILIQEEAQATINDCDIQTHCEDCGTLHFDSCSKGEIKNCKIHDGPGYGVAVVESSMVDIVESEFWGFKKAALFAHGQRSVLTVTKSLVRDTFDHGILIQEEAQSVIKDSDIQSGVEN